MRATRCDSASGTGSQVIVSQPKKLVLATRNLGKVEELQRLLSAATLDIEILGLKDFPDMPDVDETGSTFAENSLLKARAISEYTGLPALADDSGLCVDALNGDPGIYSARWSGRHGDDAANTAKVLSQLRELDDVRGKVDRSARFVCSVALVFPESHVNRDHVVIEEGEILGEIVDQPRGKNGFGYDPIFRPIGYELTTAELEPEIKDRISHRGLALMKILPHIQSLI